MSAPYDDDGFDLEENSVDDLEGFSDGIDRDDDDTPMQSNAELVLLHDAAHV